MRERKCLDIICYHNINWMVWRMTYRNDCWLLFTLQCTCYVLQEEQYAKWMAACRLAAKGRPLSDHSYESEVKSIKALLEMQHPSIIQSPVISPSMLDISVEDYIPHRFSRKLKGKVSITLQSVWSRTTRSCEIPAHNQRLTIDKKLYFFNPMA